MARTITRAASSALGTLKDNFPCMYTREDFEKKLAWLVRVWESGKNIHKARRDLYDAMDACDIRYDRRYQKAIQPGRAAFEEEIAYYRTIITEAKLLDNSRQLVRKLLQTLYENHRVYATPQTFMKRLVDTLEDPQDGWSEDTLRVRILKQFIKYGDYLSAAGYGGEKDILDFVSSQTPGKPRLTTGQLLTDGTLLTDAVFGAMLEERREASEVLSSEALTTLQEIKIRVGAPYFERDGYTVDEILDQLSRLEEERRKADLFPTSVNTNPNRLLDAYLEIARALNTARLAADELTGIAVHIGDLQECISESIKDAKNQKKLQAELMTEELTALLEIRLDIHAPYLSRYGYTVDAVLAQVTALQNDPNCLPDYGKEPAAKLLQELAQIQQLTGSPDPDIPMLTKAIKEARALQSKLRQAIRNEAKVRAEAVAAGETEELTALLEIKVKVKAKTFCLSRKGYPEEAIPAQLAAVRNHADRLPLNVRDRAMELLELFRQCEAAIKGIRDFEQEFPSLKVKANDLRDTVRRAINKVVKSKQKYDLVALADELAFGIFKPEGHTREAMYLFALVYGMTWYPHQAFASELIGSQIPDAERDIQVRLFRDYYCNHFLRNLSETYRDNKSAYDTDPSGLDINFKNFAEMVYLYYIVKDNLTPPEDYRTDLQGEARSRTWRILSATEMIQRLKGSKPANLPVIRTGLTEYYIDLILRHYREMQEQTPEAFEQFIRDHFDCTVKRTTEEGQVYTIHPLMVESDEDTARRLYTDMWESLAAEDYIIPEQVLTDLDEYNVGLKEQGNNPAEEENFWELLKAVDEYLENAFPKSKEQKKGPAITRARLIAANYHLINAEYADSNSGISFDDVFEIFQEDLDEKLLEAHYQPISSKILFDVLVATAAYLHINSQ